MVCPLGSHQNASITAGNTTEACCVYDVVVVEFTLEGEAVSEEDVRASILQLLLGAATAADGANASAAAAPNITISYTQRATRSPIL